MLNANLQSPPLYPWLGGTGMTFVRTIGGAYSGNAYITMTPPTGGNGTLYQSRPFDGTATTAYHEEAALRCGPENATSCTIVLRLICKPASGAVFVDRWTVVEPNDGTWRLYDHDPPLPGITHVTAEISFISGQTIGIDAAMLTAPFGGP
jgi:hypothetical protein